MSEELTMLRVTEIYPHPDNPRKDVGDVTELADSVKKRGILQNLTVMPGHWLTKKERDEATEQYVRTPTDELKELLETNWTEEGYTTLIGRRRTAAARQAGIKYAPCRVVTGLTQNEQISMMLEENMQRNDLTIYEQAESFQLMLDLGDTVDSLAEKTGFSKSTIYHRLNLAKLDHDIIRKKEEDGSFQMNLKDMYELEKIDDVEERNKILSKATSSSSLKYAIEQNVREKERAKRLEQIIEELEAMGVQKTEDNLMYYNPEYESVAYINMYNDDAKTPEIEDTTDLYYYTTSTTIYVKRKVAAVEEGEKPQEESELGKINRQIREKTDQLANYEQSLMRHYEEFCDMAVSGDIEIKDDLQLIRELIIIGLRLGFTDMDLDRVCSWADGNYDEYDPDDEDEDIAIENEQKIDKARNRALNLPVTVYVLLALKESLDYITIYRAWNNALMEENATRCFRLITIIRQLGFIPDEDELAFLKGTHPLFDEINELERQKASLQENK